MHVIAPEIGPLEQRKVRVRACWFRRCTAHLTHICWDSPVRGTYAGASAFSVSDSSASSAVYNPACKDSWSTTCARLTTVDLCDARSKPLSRRNLMRRQLTPTCNGTGLKGVNRHANATLLDSVGRPLSTTQALLGHSSAEITREIYLHSIPVDAKDAVEKIEKLVEESKAESELIGPNRTQAAEVITPLIQ